MVTDGTNANQLELLTVGQAAKYLNVHPNTLRRWEREGVLSSYRIGPRGDRRFDKADVVKLLKGKTD